VRHICPKPPYEVGQISPFYLGQEELTKPLLALGAIIVIIQWWRRRTAWAIAAATLALVLLTYGAFAVIAVTAGRNICM
jgi:hypothetical protein